jgi:hypothetical protein
MTEDERIDLCFVHVPKTAGLSWLQMIVDSLGERDFVERGANHTIHRFRDRPDLQLTRIGHERRIVDCMTLRQYRAKRVGPSFVVAFVRNPYDRLVSAFHFLNREDIPPRDRSDFEQYLARYGGDFGRFVLDAFEPERPTIFQQLHLRPQYEWLVDGDGKLLTDFVGRFENLAADTRVIEDRLGFSATPIPHLNVTEHLPYGDYYDQTTRRLVARGYEKDFELFGYDPNE